MILVKRSAVPPPRSLQSARARAARAQAAEFFSRSASDYAQESAPFDASVTNADDVVARLGELFAQKCAYCESPIARPGELFVNHFRPSSGVLEPDGSYSALHYYWLAYQWSNLYPACAGCASMKGNRFPVAGPRAKVGTKGNALRAEQPLLLDPCADDPDEHFVYDEDGLVASDTERGRATIECFNLNRSDLLMQRRQALQAADAALLQFRRQEQPGQSSLSDTVRAMLDPRHPFAGIQRQFINEWLHDDWGTWVADHELADETSRTLVSGVGNLVTPQRKLQTVADFHSYQIASDDYSLRTQKHDTRLFSRMRAIERIVIENFKVIRGLDLVFPPASGEQPPWMMLLGENGTGKSSVLQAVVLALVGDKERRRLQRDRHVRLNPGALVTNGETSGRIQVFLSGSASPVELTFRRNASAFKSKPTEPQVLVFGYGATRLLPRIQAKTPTGTDYARVANLFNPFVSLTDARRWLLSLEGDAFDQAARALKELLLLRSEDRLSPNSEHDDVIVELAGNSHSIVDLSAGFESVLALTCDIIEVMLSWWPRVEVAEGIVAIDELCAHLHPRWRMRIVNSLRRVFPRVQFLCSTHDPLALKGMRDGEIVVLRRQLVGDREEVVAVTDLPSVQGLRVDQLLTSEHFGLNSTLDPELDGDFTEYFRLKALPTRTAAEERRHEALKVKLAPTQLLGTTPREQIMVDVLDTYVAQSATITDRVARGELREETKQRVARMLAEVRSGRSTS